MGAMTRKGENMLDLKDEALLLDHEKLADIVPKTMTFDKNDAGTSFLQKPDPKTSRDFTNQFYDYHY